MSSAKKPYRLEHRRRQAKLQVEETRRAIVAAARRMFARKGYVATTIEAIARDAGVATQTVYANFGSKSSIFEAVVEFAATEPDLLDIAAQYGAASSDPQRQLRLAAAFGRRLFHRLSDIFDALPGAAAAEPALARLRLRQEEGRRSRSRGIIAAWAESGGLRPGLTKAEATDVMFAIACPELFRLLVTRSGWSPERYEEWLVTTLEWLLLGQQTPAAVPPRRRRGSV